MQYSESYGYGTHAFFVFVFVSFVSGKKEGRSSFELIASVSVVDRMFQLGSLIN